MSHNPLIDYPDLPPFSEIRPEHVKPAVEQLVEAGRERIRKVLADGDFSYRALELTLATRSGNSGATGSTTGSDGNSGEAAGSVAGSGVPVLQPNAKRATATHLHRSDRSCIA